MESPSGCICTAHHEGHPHKFRKLWPAPADPLSCPSCWRWIEPLCSKGWIDDAETNRWAFLSSSSSLKPRYVRTSIARYHCGVRSRSKFCRIRFVHGALQCYLFVLIWGAWDTMGTMGIGKLQRSDRTWVSKIGEVPQGYLHVPICSQYLMDFMMQGLLQLPREFHGPSIHKEKNHPINIDSVDIIRHPGAGNRRKPLRWTTTIQDSVDWTVKSSGGFRFNVGIRGSSFLSLESAYPNVYMERSTMLWKWENLLFRLGHFQ